MEAFTRPASYARCLRYSHRTRILGIRSLSSDTTFTLPPPKPLYSSSSATKSKPEPVPAATAASAGEALKAEAIKPRSSQALLTLQPQTLHSYTTAPVPTPAQLVHSTAFFASGDPTHLWTGAYFRQFPASTHPEVAFLGRSNVGKSSLLNALFNRPRARTAHVSKKPGRTRTMNAFGVGPEKVDIAEGTERWKSLGRGGVVVVDMPGYGKGSREEWGTEIMKYLEKRKQTFLLLDVEHGPKQTDLALLAHLRNQGIQHQIILSKVDKLLFRDPKPPSPQKMHNGLLKLQRTIEDIKDRVGQPHADVLCVSAEKDLSMVGMPRSGRLGVDAVRWAVLRACGLDCDEQGRPTQYETFAAP